MKHIESIIRGYESFKRVSNRSMPEVEREEGFGATKISVVFDTRVDH